MPRGDQPRSPTATFTGAENLGFAITPGAELTLTVTLLDAGGKLLAANTYVSGERKGGSYMMSASPEDRISKRHEIWRTLAQSVPDIQGKGEASGDRALIDRWVVRTSISSATKNLGTAWDPRRPCPCIERSRAPATASPRGTDGDRDPELVTDN
jgi:hypothetical protein